MSFASTLPRLRGTLALRLTLWYAAIFALSSALAFAIAFALIGVLLAERIDGELREDLGEYALHWRQEGLDRVRQEMQLDTQGADAHRSYFRLWGGGGRLLATTDLTAWPGLARTTPRTLPPAGLEPVIETQQAAPRGAPARTLVAAIGPDVWLEIGVSLEDTEALRDEILLGFVLSLALVLLLGGPIGWFMARRALRGVEAVTRTAAEIAAGALDRRVPLGVAGHELDELARTFNAMLERIQALVVGMRDVTDNLAHDLRSPLARIRACAEMSLTQGEASGAAWAADAIEECDRLLEMLNSTLDIAEADSGAARLALTRVDLAELARDATELFESVAEDRGIGLVADAPAHCWIEGDRQRLQRAVANLIDNALKYTPSGGAVKLTLTEQPQRVLLAIEDSGVGISADDLPRIFQRFYRCDPSRTGPGIGLGLSLAKAFVRAHGGDIDVASTLGRGSCFTVVLPRPVDAEIADPSRSGHPLLTSAA